MSAIILSTGGYFLVTVLNRTTIWCCDVHARADCTRGIVVNNNIVLIDTFNEFRRKGYSHREAAYLGLTRFRPVVLTAITTILGLVPMVFSLTIRFSERCTGRRSFFSMVG